MTNLSTVGSIFLIGSIATFYTTIGGIKGVIWVDVFQTCVMFFGIILIFIKGTMNVNGLSNVWTLNKLSGRLNFLIFDLNPFIIQSNWSNFLGTLIFFSVSYGIDQQMIQRFKAAKNPKIAQKAILFNIPGIFILISLCSFSGLVIYANFAFCDPLSDSKISKVYNPNQLVPFFIKTKLSDLPGLPGLILAAIFSACLSTVSSLLSSQASILWNDILKKITYFDKFNDNQSLKIIKLIILLFGVICTIFSFLISKIGANVFQISLYTL